ncbi:hypothetical protein [Paenibacillus taichungensis]
MKNPKDIILRKWNPKFLIGMYGIALITYIVAATFIFGANILSHVATAVGSMFIGSIGLQTVWAAKRREKVSLLNVLEYAENSLLDVWQTGKYFYYHMRRFRQPILLMILVYAANAGGAKWALEKWGNSLAESTQLSILESIRIVYTAASALFFMGAILAVVWVFIKIAIRNHLSGAEDKVDSIMSSLKEEGIEASFFHGQDGRCYLDATKILNIIANGEEKTDSKTALYWDIKNNYDLLLRVEFFPFGKPKTLVQQFAEHIQKVQVQSGKVGDQA